MPALADDTVRLDMDLADPDATEALGAALAALAAPDDAILLSGEIGAGKSHLARALIRAAVARWGGTVEEIPSPSYTLVQTYETPQGEIWHADLYRLGDPGDLIELGLDEAFGRALVLVEWPDRLGALAPRDGLSITLAVAGTGRRATLSGPASRWRDRLATLGANAAT